LSAERRSNEAAQGAFLELLDPKGRGRDDDHHDSDDDDHDDSDHDDSDHDDSDHDDHDNDDNDNDDNDDHDNDDHDNDDNDDHKHDDDDQVATQDAYAVGPGRVGAEQQRGVPGGVPPLP
jgi:hypothetical protein